MARKFVILKKGVELWTAEGPYSEIMIDDALLTALNEEGNEGNEFRVGEVKDVSREFVQRIARRLGVDDKAETPPGVLGYPGA